MSAPVEGTKTDCRVTGVCGRQGRACPNAGFACRILLRAENVSPKRDGAARWIGRRPA
ncbi:hypothetical protein MPLSOD_90060 [Mesorhizobium sp. SOD10]|nr:hypothetical protein MPLSOD_90060 [Mesorhizobium sp. SOD10]